MPRGALPGWDTPLSEGNVGYMAGPGRAGPQEAEPRDH